MLFLKQKPSSRIGKMP
jgi:hypothetical protein